MASEDSFVIITRSDIASATDTLHTVDTNCACPDTDSYLATQAAINFVGLPLSKARLHTEQLTTNAYLAFNPLGQSGPVLLNTAAWQLLQHFEQPQSADLVVSAPTQEAALQRLLAHDLLEPLGTQRHFVRGEEQTLVAWLHTTNACNLRCTYCYIDKSDEVMEESTGYAAVGAIFRTAQQHGYPKVKLKYAGGEATLNFGLVTKLHA